MFIFFVMNMNHPFRPALASSDRILSELFQGSAGVFRRLKLSLKLDFFFLLFHSEKGMEARVRIGQVWLLSAASNPHPQRLRHQRHAASCASNIPIIKDFRRFVKLRHYAPTNHPILTNYSFITCSLALSLALNLTCFSQNGPS